MTNHHIKAGHSEVTQATGLQPEALGEPRVRRVALIRADGSGFKLVAAPTKRLG
jgi:hypothetical protein